MKIDNINKVIIFHHNDNDGIVSASVLIKTIRDKQFIPRCKINTIMVDYTMILEDLVDEKDIENSIIYFLDYSFSNEINREWLLKLLSRKDCEVIWIDHHKTSIEMSSMPAYKDIKGCRSEHGSGAMLTQIYCDLFYTTINRFECNKLLAIETINDLDFYTNLFPVSYFIRLIDDYDRWANKLADSRAFHYGADIGTDPFSDNLIGVTGYLSEKYYYNKVLNSIKKGHTILDYEMKQNKEFHMDMYSFEFTIVAFNRKYKCIGLNRKGNSLMFGDTINEYDIVCPFFFNGEKWTYSLFTNKDDINCEAIARLFDGGGHRKAAGFVSESLLFKKDAQITI